MSMPDAVHRSFFERFSELVPTEQFSAVLVSQDLNSYGLVATGANTLEQSTGYAGTLPELWGPARSGTPKKLGFRAGDIIQILTVPAGGPGSNDGKTFMIKSVTATVITVYETLIVESLVCTFRLFRRMP